MHQKFPIPLFFFPLPNKWVFVHVIGLYNETLVLYSYLYSTLYRCNLHHDDVRQYEYEIPYVVPLDLL